jgi:DNA-binding response OmpR family regulator
MVATQISSRRRVLILEDEVAIAFEIEAVLSEAGFEPVGPAIDVQRAVDLLSSTDVDAAVLDVGLVAQSVDGILKKLVEENTPILFMTGYDEAALPAWVPPTGRIIKPYHMPDLVAHLTSMIDKARPDQTGRAMIHSQCEAPAGDL